MAIILLSLNLHQMNATKSVVVITNVDSLLGFSLAYRFLKRWKEKSATEFRLLCRHKEGLQELQNLGGRVIEIHDYGDKDTIMNVLKSATYVMYFTGKFFGRRQALD